MKVRLKVLGLLCLLSLAAVWFFWPSAGRLAPVVKSSAAPPAPSVATTVAPVASNILAATSAPVGRSAASTNRVAFRLTNTPQIIGELTTAPHAILLENALVDTDAKLNLDIPKHLRAKGEPGAFIVQARGLVDAAFRTALASAGAQIVSYIPNNAYLVQLSGAGAGVLAGNPLVQAVLPFDPYFKVQASLLGRAVDQKTLPDGQVLTLGLFASGAEATVLQIEKLGGKIVGTDRSPFGPVVRVLPATDWLALAQLPGVQRVEPATLRKAANDLARVAMGISTNYFATNANYLNLTGSNVLVEVNDTGIDAAHKDFSATGNALSPGANPPTRVTGDSLGSLNDTDGHGTHVAGIIAGNGSQSLTVTTPPRGSVTNADFRGKAPLAKLYSVGFLGNDTNFFVSDQNLQAAPANTNALISNNSWVNGNANEYDLSAASYDAAVRDALPEKTGPQPVLFVFAAGNDGAGDGDGGGGNADSILSPGTAKNVITVGALEQFRDITNIVTALDGTSNAVWQAQTSSSNEVAFYSARGNVGVQTEGAYGRFKPDVVAPGTFVVSTRSTTWDQAAYYNPTNYHNDFSHLGVFLETNQLEYGSVGVPVNAVGVRILVLPNRQSPSPFPTNFPIYLTLTGQPGPTNSGFATSNNVLAIPPGGGAFTTITPLVDQNFSWAVGNPTNFSLNFDVFVTIITTNDDGDALTVLSNLNNTLGTGYLYESGTSMAAPAVSGALALMQDFFTNTLHTIPSPALLKAMLINGARLTAGYSAFAVTNNINYEGWGLVNVPNSIPVGLTNTVTGTNGTPMFFIDQSPTNVLATGGSRTYSVMVPSAAARAQLLRLTLAWTDPPGNPAAGLKLVNNLDLIVTNLDSGKVYYGNNFASSATPFTISNSNAVPDSVNNVENIWLTAPLGTNYSVTVLGRNVTVNAVTLDQTNIVQDYALVISCGDSANTNGIIVTTPTPAVAASLAPTVTFVASYTNGIYFNQVAGASAPWLSTNGLGFSTNSSFATNANLFIGQTNQWHFFVVTNTTTYTNAAFIIFLPETKSVSRLGVFEDSTANATRPEADLNLFVASNPGDLNAPALTNLDQTVISNCVFNANGDQASLDRGGTKFIVYTNSTPGQVYYVGVQCQDQTAAEFGFLSVFSQNAFSQLNPDGSQTVNGLLLPMPIPDGNNAHPGVAYVFALAIYPMTVGDVTVTNSISHQNYGDLVGALTHGSAFAVLNNHNGDAPIPAVNYTRVYNDDGHPGTAGTDGPGSLRNFRGTQGVGPWLLTEVDDAFTASGSVTGFTLNVQPHKDLTHGLQTVTVGPQSWYYGYVDVPVGYTNITVVATNLPPTSTPPLQLYLNYNVEPTFTNYLGFVLLTNGTPFPGNSISYGPPMLPGRYFVGLYNPDFISHDVLLGATLAFNPSAISSANYDSTGKTPLIDDAVTYLNRFVTNTDLIQAFSVGLRVDHQRISDLVFHLISPDGTRYLLMENRGGQTTNGAGVTVVTTNIVNVTANGGAQAETNYINVGTTSGTFPITYNFYNAPDQMTVYYGTNAATFTTNSANLLYNTGMTNNGPPGGPYTPTTFTVTFPPAGAPATSTYLTIVMNQFGNSDTNTQWTYTAGGIITNNYYLSFTENTNSIIAPIATTPIKYAVPPFVPATAQIIITTNTNLGTPAVADGFEFVNAKPPAPFPAGSHVSGWLVVTGNVDVFYPGYGFFGLPDSGTNCLELNGNNAGAISTNFNTIVGTQYVLNFAYTKNPGPAPGFIASAQIDLTGQSSIQLNTDPALTNSYSSLNWARTSIVFTATSPSTTLQFSALNSGNAGMYLDTVTVSPTNLVTTNFFYSNLYYQPEDDISGLVGTSPYGPWQLEILDNRAGATNNANLVSWELAFTFANTNFTIPTIVFTNGNGPITNTIPGGATQWYLINTPTNADWVTNTLIFATLPLNMWWSTNVPPTTTNAADVLMLPNSTGGAYPFSTNSASPPFFVPGGTYYLGIQNSNATVATYAIDVRFHLLSIVPSVITRPATNIALTTATLQALVNPNGSLTTAYFEYGTTTNYGSVSTTFGLTNNLFLQQAVSIDVTNLTASTLYHFRAVATNSFGTNYGADLTFITIPLPFAASVPATLLNGSSAQLNGFASPNGTPATAWFEFGTGSSYGLQTPLVNVGSNSAVVFVTNQISGLITNQPYHFRLVVSNAVGVAYGFDQIFDQGNVVAWGADYFGQATVPSGLTNLVVGIGTGYDTSLAVNNNGTVVAWGDNTFGQTNPPASLTNAVFVDGGSKYSLALRSDRTVLAWGSGQFGLTNPPASLTNAVGAAGGSSHCLALRTDGNVAAWGFNSSGQTNIPAGLSNLVAVAAGEVHSLALRDNGTVVAWGYNGDGETNVPPGLSDVVAIAAGGYHSLALKRDGTVVAWGYNGTGETNVPPGLTNVIAIAGGAYHSLAVLKNGTVVGWGDNSANQLTLPSGLTNAFAVAGGGLHSLALTAQFGLNQTNNRPFWLTNPPTLTMGTLTVVTVTNKATDTNLAVQTLTYSLLSTNNWVNINQFSGIITLAPLATDGPSTNVIITKVTDNGYPPLSATNSFTVIVTNSVVPPLTNVSISGIVYTNIGGSTNGFLLTWFAPSNALFQVQATTNLAPANWITFTNPPVVSYNTNVPVGPTNAQFNFFDDGSQFPFGPTRFYRLILLGNNTAPVFIGTPASRFVNPQTTLTITNTATDADLPAQLLTYSLTSSVAGTNVPTINPTNGIITWTPTLTQAGTTNTLTSIVTDNGTPNLSATNSFNVFVNPVPSISSVTVVTNGVSLQWTAWTNQQFNVRWSTNLAPPVVWGIFPDLITSTNGLFTFVDTNALFAMKFYQLILLP